MMAKVHEVHAERMRNRPAQQPRTIPPAEVRRIIQAASIRFTIPARFIRDGTQRHGPAVAARRQIARELHSLGYSTTLIGRWLGGLNHSSVLYMLRNITGVKRRGALPGDLKSAPFPDLSGEWAI
jgi:chromosomal replication initiation ATPase DnaA